MCSPLSLPSGVQPFLDLPICKVESNSCKQTVKTVYYEECIGLLPCNVQDYATKEDLLYQKLQVPLVEAFVKTLKDPQKVEASKAEKEFVRAYEEQKLYMVSVHFHGWDWSDREWSNEFLVDVYRENLVWTPLNLLGNIGGQLSLWIGFTCTGSFSWIVSILPKVWKICKGKFNKEPRSDNDRMTPYQD